MYKHILLALDNADSDAKLLKKAYTLAASHNARLSLLHVVDFIPSDAGGPLGLPLDNSLPQQLAQTARQKLDTLCREMPAPDNVLLDSHVTLGAARHEIVVEAKERCCDLIMMGHHAHHGLGHLLGHTDESVLHHAPCDVLAVNLSQS